MTALQAALSFVLAERFRTARRLAIGMSGQTVISAFNFAVNITLIRTLPATDYGLFAMAQ